VVEAVRTPAAHARLPKALGVIDVYAVALGTTLSAGLFLLPGLAVSQAGPAIVLSYLLAAVPLIPAMFSVVELATAMPRAGGTYYFLDRSFGPLVGAVGGLGTWLALVLKAAFASIGMGAYLSLWIPGLPIVPVAAGLALALALVNVWGTRKTSTLQIALVFVLLGILTSFVAGGAPQARLDHFAGFFDAGFGSILATSGLVYVSYVGITNIASLAEEVRDPERNFPRGIFLALLTAIVLYVLVTFAMVGAVPVARLAGDLTPAATAAGTLFGTAGAHLITGAALLASASVASAGILSASRYPLAMSRDHVLPTWFRSLGRFGTPVRGIGVTVVAVVAAVVLFDPTHIAKLAGAFQLLMFALLNIAVIVMRESGIASYDPGYRAPAYPWLQLAGVAGALGLIASMGWAPTLFSLALVAISVAWYYGYARPRVVRAGAIYHVFERLGRRRFTPLDVELRGILKEKGLREQDPFDAVVGRAQSLELEEGCDYEEAVARAARVFGERLGVAAEILERGFLEGTRIGATPVEHGVAIPHTRMPDIAAPELVLMRSRGGVRIEPGAAVGRAPVTELTHALFFVVSPDREASQHLRFLAHLAVQVDDAGFMPGWLATREAHALPATLLRGERSASLHVTLTGPAADWIDRPLREVDIPGDCLVALVTRGDATLVPHGATVIRAGDQLTVIGNPQDVGRFRSWAHGSDDG